ncbi:MAG: FkbM family methyltransferase [Pseudanabaena sp. ELA645]|jgi:FkbM family methyltransferase
MATKILGYISKKINQFRFKFLNRGLSQNQIAISKGIILNVHSDAYYAFRYFTDFDEDMIKEMKSFISLTNGKKCFLDIGAHYGIFSLVFSSNVNTLALALDPSPSACRMLEHHQELNPKCHIQSFQLAIGDSEGKLQMQPDVYDHFTMTKSDISVVDKLVEVDVTTIDSFIALNNIMPDVIKIDTEGFELNVLRGGIKFFESCNPMIFLEVHPDFLRQLGYSLEELVALLTQLNYKLYDLDFKLIQNPLSYLGQDIRRIICCK